MGVMLVAAACADDVAVDTVSDAQPLTTLGTTDTSVATTGGVTAPTGLVSQTGFEFPAAPAVVDGPLDEATVASIDDVFGSFLTGVDPDDVRQLGDSGDVRVAWLLSDVLRFAGGGGMTLAAADAFRALTGADLEDDPLSERNIWQSLTNHLLAWDLPAPPGYLDWKRIPFEIVEPRWQPFFDDADADIDWRHLSWGGVRIDDRPLGDPNPCASGCIPALDDPVVTDSVGGDWYPDDAIVFGVVVGDQSRAYPKNIMEVHEMVNDTLGGRRIGVPYCTLCGSAQGYFTDAVPGRETPLVLRTTGLLTRSNKVMYELTTTSLFDTFLGVALSGPLQDREVVLEQIPVVTSTWGDWKQDHPETTIVSMDAGIGREYPADPLGGRDDDGPIFPIGAVDDRLGASVPVLGVVTPDAGPVAFPVDAVRQAIESGAAVELGGAVVVEDGSGLRAEDSQGRDLAGHQALWFAWSQFQPGTDLWTP